MVKLKAYALAALAFISAVLSAWLLKIRGDRYKEQKEATEGQRDAVIGANQALQEAQEQGRQEVRNEVSKAKSGDRTHFESEW